MRDDFVGAQGERAAPHDDGGAPLREVRRPAEREGERAVAVFHQVEAVAGRAREVALDQRIARAVHGPGAVERELGGAQAAGEGDRLAGDVLAEGDVGDVAAEVDDIGEREGMRPGERLGGVVQEGDGAAEGTRAADRFDRGVAEADADGSGRIGRRQAQGAAEDFQAAGVGARAAQGEHAVADLGEDAGAADGAVQRAGGDRQASRREGGVARVRRGTDAEVARPVLRQGQGAAQAADGRIQRGTDRQGRRGRRGVGEGAEAGEARQAERVAVEIEGAVRVDADQGRRRQGRGDAQTDGAGRHLQRAGERRDGVEREHAAARLGPRAGAGEAGREGDVVGAEIERSGEAGRDGRKTGREIGGLRAGPAQRGVALEGDRAGAEGAGREGERASRETDATGEGARAGQRQQAGAALRQALAAREIGGEGAFAGDVEAEEGPRVEIAGRQGGDDVRLANGLGEGERGARGDRPAARGGESAERGGRCETQFAGGDGGLTGEAGGVAGKLEEAVADLIEGSAAGEATGEAAGRGFEHAGADGGQSREVDGAVQADGACARLGERAGTGGEAGHGQGHAGRHVEHATG